MSHPAPSHFGSIHVIEPKSHHTHTAILLHGRGSNGEEFAEEFFGSKSSSHMTPAEALPGWRWVFPSSRDLWSTAFQEEMPAWFEAHSLGDPTARQDLQIPGIKDSVGYLDSVLSKEIEMLGGVSEKIVLGGISQGGAIGLWTWMCAGTVRRRLGAFVGASTWLPFATNIREFLVQKEEGGKGRDRGIERSMASNFVESMMAPLKHFLGQQSYSTAFLSTPVFLGHGTDDAYVDIALGRQLHQLLVDIGLKVEWKEYSGAEQEGHWLKEPEEMDDITSFLKALN